MFILEYRHMEEWIPVRILQVGDFDVFGHAANHVEEVSNITLVDDFHAFVTRVFY